MCVCVEEVYRSLQTYAGGLKAGVRYLGKVVVDGFHVRRRSFKVYRRDGNEDGWG